MVLGSASCVIYGSVTHLNDFSCEKNRGRRDSNDSKFYRNDVN